MLRGLSGVRQAMWPSYKSMWPGKEFSTGRTNLKKSSMVRKLKQKGKSLNACQKITF